MGSGPTYHGPVRSGPRSANPNAGVCLMCMEFEFDPTQAAGTGTGYYLPSNVIPVDVICDGGATGGVNPTVDIGLTGDSDGLSNEQDADAATSAVAAGVGGALIHVLTTSEKEILAGVGASAATGGTVKCMVLYIQHDDKNAVNSGSGISV